MVMGTFRTRPASAETAASMGRRGTAERNCIVWAPRNRARPMPHPALQAALSILVAIARARHRPVAPIRRLRVARRRRGARGATPRLPAPARQQPIANPASTTARAWRTVANTRRPIRAAKGHRHLAASFPFPTVPVNPAALSAPSRIKVLVSPPCQVKSFDLLKGQRFVIWAFAERSPRFGVKGWDTIAREE